MNKKNNSFRDGWYQTAEGKEVFTKTTAYGTLMFTLEKKELDAVIREAFFRVIDITDVPKTPEEIALMMGFEPGGKSGGTKDPKDENYISEVRIVLKETERYVRGNLPEMLDAALWFFIEEAILAAIVKRRGKGFFNLGMTELEAFKKIKTKHFDDLKKRMRISKATGAKKYWTDDKRLALLELYEKLRPLTKSAKQSYQKARKFSKWGEIIMEEYPELPKDIVDQLWLSGKNGEPGFIVLTYASPLFNKASIAYMIKQLTLAHQVKVTRC